MTLTFFISCLFLLAAIMARKKKSKIIPINGDLQTKYMRKTNWLEPQNSGHCGFYNSDLTRHLIEKKNLA